MTETSRPHNADQEIGVIREIVQRHRFPDFVMGFDVQLGQFDDEPALWVIFRTTGQRPSQLEERRNRARLLSALRQEVQADLQEHIMHRYPYFRFENIETMRPAAE